MNSLRNKILIVCALFLAAGCGRELAKMPTVTAHTAQVSQAVSPVQAARKPVTAAEKILNNARKEVERGVVYDASYQTISYPGGDVKPDRGACTDVIIRGLRSAGFDLQKLIHEDRKRHPGLYPTGRNDSNIDHRRVSSQVIFMRRFGKALPVAVSGKAIDIWLPGDFVYWKLDSNLDHCGIITDWRNPDGLPFVIHNIGQEAEEGCLTRWKIVAHCRYPTH